MKGMDTDRSARRAVEERCWTAGAKAEADPIRASAASFIIISVRKREEGRESVRGDLGSRRRGERLVTWDVQSRDEGEKGGDRCSKYPRSSFSRKIAGSTGST
jgi:hypothetical protein